MSLINSKTVDCNCRNLTGTIDCKIDDKLASEGCTYMNILKYSLNSNFNLQDMSLLISYSKAIDSQNKSTCFSEQDIISKILTIINR